MIGRRAALRMGAVSLLSAAVALAGGTWALMERAFTVPPSPGGRPAPAADGPADPWGFEEIDWAGWARESPDMAAWVQIPAAGLSLPVMAAPADDPGRYLDRDAWGGWNFAGTPFLDAECAGDFDAGCAPVLGHHLAGGRGFSVLAGMSEESRAAELSLVLLQTPQWRRVYDAMFVSVVDAARGGKRIGFADAADFAAWWEEERARAAVVLDAETVPDRALQLVTCSYTTYANERTVVTCAPRLQLPAGGAGAAP